MNWLRKTSQTWTWSWLWRVVVFPWGIWCVVAAGPRYLRQGSFGGRRISRILTYVLQAVVYLVAGLPLTVFLLIELLISANEAVIAEQADYRVQSDWEETASVATFDVPGPKSYRPQPVPPGATEESRRYLVELYSPVIYQKVSGHPEWDIPVLIDFDGNDDPTDNVVNARRVRPDVAGVYGEVTAETEDSYYLTYSLYHIRDYDHPVREAINSLTNHDNDNEGYHIRIDRKTMEVVEVETWYHNRFLFFNRTGKSTGSEPVHGKIHTEDDTHVILYAQPQGHGVRLAQLLDLESLDRRVKILRYRGDREVVRVRVDGSVQVDATYELDDFDTWYAYALSSSEIKGSGGMFVEWIPLGENPDGSERRIGRFFAGGNYESKDRWGRPKPEWAWDELWVRAKPMWSWDDIWDQIPIMVWHFFPSISFQSHGGSELSHAYSYNRPCEKVFGEPPPDVLASLTLLERTETMGEKPRILGGDPFKRLDEERRPLYWLYLHRKVSSYVNYVFHALG